MSMPQIRPMRQVRPIIVVLFWALGVFGCNLARDTAGASGTQGPAPTTPLQRASHGTPCPPGRMGDEGEGIVTRPLDHHDAPGEQGDFDAATLVGPPSGPVDVGQADRQSVDPRREPPQGEPQSLSGNKLGNPSRRDGVVPLSVEAVPRDPYRC